MNINRKMSMEKREASSWWTQCAEGHPTRMQRPDDLLLACGCVFDPNALNRIDGAS